MNHLLPKDFLQPELDHLQQAQKNHKVFLTECCISYYGLAPQKQNRDYTPGSWCGTLAILGDNFANLDISQLSHQAPCNCPTTFDADNCSEEARRRLCYQLLKATRTR